MSTNRNIKNRAEEENEYVEHNGETRKARGCRGIYHAVRRMQDTILDAYEHIGSLKKEEYFKTWIVRILINRCTKRYRMNQRKAYLEDYSKEAVCDAGRAEVEFRQMLAALPDDSRVIFQLYYGEQFTIREIGEILGINENTIKSRLHRGKEQLRSAIEGNRTAFHRPTGCNE